MHIDNVFCDKFFFSRKVIENHPHLHNVYQCVVFSCRLVESKPETLLSLQAIFVPAPNTASTSHTGHTSHTGSREQASNSNMAAASPPSGTLPPNASSPLHLPSPPMSLYQENEVLQQQQRESISPEPANEQSSSQIQSPPLQFDLHESFLHPPGPNYAHPPASSAYAIQAKPVSMFPLLSPIYSEGSPVLTEDRDWMMSPSHSHADLHKAGNQRMEHELSPIGLGLHVSGEEEEEGGAVGGGGNGIMLTAIQLDKLSEVNGMNSEHHRDGSYGANFGEKQGLILAPETVSVMTTPGGDGEKREETELMEMAEVGDEKLTEVDQSEQMESEKRTFQLGNDQLDVRHKDAALSNSFQGDLAPPTAVVEYPHSPGNGPGGGFIKTGLATPHMIRSSTWEPAADEKQTQVIYRTSIQEGSQSPQTDSHFLEDFID